MRFNNLEDTITMRIIFSILGLLLLTTEAFAAQDESQPQDEQPAVATPVEAPTSLPPLDLDTAKLGKVRSAAVLVIEQEQERPLYAKNIDTQMPIASITKLMTAMVVLDAELPLDEPVTINKEDVDTKRGTRSKLKVGVTLSRGELLQLALMASENRAAAALASSYPGGVPAFVAAMNQKAAALEMTQTYFVEPTGLDSRNVSTAQDLVKMVKASYGYELIREYTTATSKAVAGTQRKSRPLSFHNSNRLVVSKSWDIGLSKTGYIRDSGRCLVLQARIAEQPLIIVLLDSWGKYTRIADANRIKRWIENSLLARKPRSS